MQTAQLLLEDHGILQYFYSFIHSLSFHKCNTAGGYKPLQEGLTKSVKMSSDVSVINYIKPQFILNLKTTTLGHGWHLALGLCSTQAAPLCCAMQVCAGCTAQGLCSIPGQSQPRKTSGLTLPRTRMAAGVHQSHMQNKGPKLPLVYVRCTTHLVGGNNCRHNH